MKALCLMIAVFTSSLLSSCMPEEEPPPNPELTLGDLASIVDVVWDASEDHGNEGYDERYIVIDDRGSIVNYDYEGDTYDSGDDASGEDCYDDYSIEAIRHTGSGQKYDYYFDGKYNNTFVIYLNADGSLHFDNFDTWQRAGLALEDLTPKC